MSERFFLDQPVNDAKATLVGDQAHHLARVMRAKAGDEVLLFDGQGNEYKATIDEVSKKNVTLTIDSAAQIPNPNLPEIIVACALPKGDRQKFLVEKLVELGANRLIPLDSARSVAEANEKVFNRITKQIIEASKQCRRNWLMEISPALSVDQLINEFGRFTGSRLLADPYVSSDSDVLFRDEPAVIAVGPEGGFTREESQLLCDNNWQTVCFSPNVLRIETAATAAVAIARLAKSKHKTH